MYYDMPPIRKYSTVVNTAVGDCIMRYTQNTLHDTMIMIQNI
jgi:hypothetical protein